MAPFDYLPKVKVEMPITNRVQRQQTENNLEARKKQLAKEL
jgi:hypothetical protein